VDELTGRVAAVFARLGLPEEDARVVVDHLVEADLRGVHSHGVIRVPTQFCGITARFPIVPDTMAERNSS